MKPIRRMLALTPSRLLLEPYEPLAPNAGARRDLDAVVNSFATGYNAALDVSRGALDLSHVPAAMRGFAYEGAAMSRCLLDLFTGTRGRRLSGLMAGDGVRYIHLIHVGAGWAFARLRLRPWRGVAFGTPFLRWLAWDGWGFHQAYFGPERVFVRQRIERAAAGDVRPIRDQGVGRALWFYAAADPGSIAGLVAGFPADRRPDLWAGIGLAASYTGVRTPAELTPLLDAAAGHRDHLAQGAAFAAKAHSLAGEVPARSAVVIEALTGTDPATAAGWTDTALAAATRHGPDGPGGYELWRASVRREWERSGRASRAGRETAAEHGGGVRP